jgi:hypothetical protein
MTWLTKSIGGVRGERSRLSLEKTRSEIEGFGIGVLESELRKGRQSHRIAAKDWRQWAKGLLAAGFVPRPDNDAEPTGAAALSGRWPDRD